MMRVLTIVWGILVLIRGAWGVEEFLQSKVNRVSLFLNQALVERYAEAEVKEGLNKLTLPISAFDIDEASIQVKVVGEVEIYGVKLKPLYVKESPQEKIKELEGKIEKLENERKVYEDQLDVLSKEEEFLNSLICFQNQKESTDFPKISELKDLLRFLGENYKAIKEEMRQAELKIEEINKQLEVLEKELEALRRPAERKQNLLEVTLYSKGEQKVKLFINYLVRNCGWKPLYKVNVPIDLSSANLVMFADIKQKTGEDWEDVKLTISNAIPLRGGRLPELNSWYLDIVKILSRPKSLMMREAVAPALKAGGKEAKFIYAERKELPLSFEYELPQPVSVKSRDEHTLLPIFQREIKGSPFYYTVPKLSPFVYLVYQTSFDREYLPAPLNVYFANRFVGRTFLKEIKPGEPFYLNLGITRDIRVKRQKIRDKIDETFIGGIERRRVIREMAFKITLENLKNSTCLVKILDNIPVSKTDRIKVKDVKFSPQPKEVNYKDREGVCLWEVKLAPGQVKQILIEFKVTYPKDIHIQGL